MYVYVFVCICAERKKRKEGMKEGRRDINSLDLTFWIKANLYKFQTNIL